MENFIVSARKYRPSSFSSVIGQSSLTTTLQTAIKNKHLGQAYLFCGPRGVGKTTMARLFAKTINCQNPSDQTEPCEQCESCTAFNENRSFNIHELDAASNNSVDNIRDLTDQVRIPPQIGDFSVYIIDEVHMLSKSAFNAFLKTLEEPPKHAKFVLATTEKHKIPATILSRCQIFDFNRIKNADIIKNLEYIANQEGVQYEKDALALIASRADGGMRDALSIFDQSVSFCSNNLTYQQILSNLGILDFNYYIKILDHLNNEAYIESLLIFNEILEKGFHGQHFLNGLCDHIRNVLVAKSPDVTKLLDMDEDKLKSFVVSATSYELPFLIEVLDIANQFDISYKESGNKRLHVELALLNMSRVNLKKKV